MKILIEMFIFPFSILNMLKASPIFFNDQQICSLYTVVLHFIYTFQLCINLFANKICRVKAIKLGWSG